MAVFVKVLTKIDLKRTSTLPDSCLQASPQSQGSKYIRSGIVPRLDDGWIQFVRFQQFRTLYKDDDTLTGPRYKIEVLKGHGDDVERKTRCLLFVARFDTRQNLQIMDGFDILFLTNKTSSHEFLVLKSRSACSLPLHESARTWSLVDISCPFSLRGSARSLTLHESAHSWPFSNLVSSHFGQPARQVRELLHRWPISKRSVGAEIVCTLLPFKLFLAVDSIGSVVDFIVHSASSDISIFQKVVRSFKSIHPLV
ncbi:hypothetical protein J1N35_036245 [Gossypium stocksii]|uniref:Uncharacterized protein n=1 Tax=Gossypium stocksii TaxID=47602 RepID=A0A9D3UHY8_9ROSI|nr:hypothetical protein J1N35_036245 [Gossypium stocksii]